VNQLANGPAEFGVEGDNTVASAGSLFVGVTGSLWALDCSVADVVVAVAVAVVVAVVSVPSVEVVEVLSVADALADALADCSASIWCFI